MNVSRVIAAISLLVILIAIIGFVVLNPDEHVSINLGWQKYEDVPLVLALFIAFVIGVGLTLLYTLYYFIDLGLTVRRLKKRNRLLEEELIALRNLPIEESMGESEEGKDVVK